MNLYLLPKDFRRTTTHDCPPFWIAYMNSDDISPPPPPLPPSLSLSRARSLSLSFSPSLSLSLSPCPHRIFWRSFSRSDVFKSPRCPVALCRCPRRYTHFFCFSIIFEYISAAKRFQTHYNPRLPAILNCLHELWWYFCPRRYAHFFCFSF